MRGAILIVIDTISEWASRIKRATPRNIDGRRSRIGYRCAPYLPVPAPGVKRSARKKTHRRGSIRRLPDAHDLLFTAGLHNNTEIMRDRNHGGVQLVLLLDQR